jgi:hypothetical protein
MLQKLKMLQLQLRDSCNPDGMRQVVEVRMRRHSLTRTTAEKPCPVKGQEAAGCALSKWRGVMHHAPIFAHPYDSTKWDGKGDILSTLGATAHFEQLLSFTFTIFML